MYFSVNSVAYPEILKGRRGGSSGDGSNMLVEANAGHLKAETFSKNMRKIWSNCITHDAHHGGLRSRDKIFLNSGVK